MEFFNVLKKLFQFLGFILIPVGVSLLIRPSIILDWVVDNLNNQSLYIAAIGVRLLFGILLLVVAKQTKFPNAIRFFGVISISAALIFLFLGQVGFVELFSSWLPVLSPYGWITGLVCIALGGFMIYAFSEKNEA